MILQTKTLTQNVTTSAEDFDFKNKKTGSTKSVRREKKSGSGQPRPQFIYSVCAGN